MEESEEEVGAFDLKEQKKGNVSAKLDKESTLKNKKDKVIKENTKTKPKKTKKKSRDSWVYYIHKVLKTVHEEDCSLSSNAMSVLDSFAHDLFDRLANESVKLLRFSDTKTLSSAEIQSAARLVLTGELCKHAIQDGVKAVSKYQLHQSDWN